LRRFQQLQLGSVEVVGAAAAAAAVLVVEEENTQQTCTLGRLLRGVR
jgi:hypothetical protein